MPSVVRRGGSQDVPFLRDMLRHAFYWRMNAPREPDELPVSRYVGGWGRPGDTSLVALEDYLRVGAGWYRLFTAEEPGYGFVDERTPELAIAVVPSRRGKGLGTDLLERMLAEARAAGYEALSLSVATDNPSVKLYERYGFRTVGEARGAYTMRAALTDGGRD